LKKIDTQLIFHGFDCKTWFFRVAISLSGDSQTEESARKREKNENHVFAISSCIAENKICSCEKIVKIVGK